MTRSIDTRRGTALLAVLWLTAALAAIAYTVADSVRAETERAINYQDGVRAYFLARGAVERTMFLMRNPANIGGGGSPAETFFARRRLYFQEEAGDSIVELLSERGKFPLKQLNPQLFARLLEVLGENPVQAANLAQSALFLSPVNISAGAPTFRPTLASLENVEELLLLPGITSEMVYGRYTRLPDGSLVNMGGLADFLTPYKVTPEGLDPLSVHPSLLIALGMNPAEARAWAMARASVFDPNVALAAMTRIPTPVGMRPDLGDVFQVRATSRPRLPNGQLSPARRTVSLLVRYTPPNPRYMWISPWVHLRWFDQSFSELAASDAVWLTAPPPAGKGS